MTSPKKSWTRSSDPIRCLGIDPGIGRMGFGVVEQIGSKYRACSFGCLETPSDMSVPQRLDELYRGLREQINGCSPHFMAVEKLYFGRNTTTAENVWQARGVALLVGAQNDLFVLEPKPSEAKITVCGDGRAEKSQVQRMVQVILSLKEIPRPDDAADALAIALAGLALLPTSTIGRR
ncbi:MAG: crossover junction endodeoxyribonuclease RuvC [Synergistota bacterium]|nr:crossover junction endodeoxyribonuclease RuvC [Synergistota bacterium]